MSDILNRTIFLLFVLIVLSTACDQSSVREGRSDKSMGKNAAKTVKETLVKDTLIHITSKISIHWNANEKRIIKDSLSMHLRRHFDEYKFELVNAISETSSTHISACYKQNQIRKGDIAFMILEDIRNIPLSEVFQVQFDVYEANCRYPVGLFYHIEENRELVRKQTYEFLTKDK